MSDDETGRKRTFSGNAPSVELNPKQARAFEGLLEGKTVTEVARIIRVRRQTVSEWRNHHPAFRAALEAAQAEKHAVMVARLGTVSTEAVDTLHELMKPEQGPRVRLLAANAVVKGVIATQGKGPGSEPTAGIPAPFDVGRYTGEAERKRWKELTEFTPLERETMRQLYEMLVDGARKLVEIGGEKAPHLVRQYRERKAAANGSALALGNGVASTNGVSAVPDVTAKPTTDGHAAGGSPRSAP